MAEVYDASPSLSPQQLEDEDEEVDDIEVPARPVTLPPLEQHTTHRSMAAMM